MNPPTTSIPKYLLRDLVEATKRVSPRGQADADHLTAIVQHAELLLRVPAA